MTHRIQQYILETAILMEIFLNTQVEQVLHIDIELLNHFIWPRFWCYTLLRRAIMENEYKYKHTNHTHTYSNPKLYKVAEWVQVLIFH